MKIYCGIDVGTSKVLTIIGGMDDGGLRVLGVGVYPSFGIKKGVIVDIERARESIRESVKRAERTSGLRVGKAFVSVSGRHVYSFNSKGLITIPEDGKKPIGKSDIKRVLDSARDFPLPPDREVLHTITRKYILDGQSGVDAPLGLHGFKLEAETHIVTVSSSPLHNLRKGLKGVEIEGFILSSIAASEAVLKEEEKEGGVAVVDIGAGVCDIAVYRDGSVLHTSVLPLRGENLTKDLSTELGISFELAEDMKKMGNVLGGREGEIEVREGVKAPREEVDSILRARAEEFLRFIYAELSKPPVCMDLPHGIVFTGGSSKLPGFLKLAEDMLSLPVRMGVPRNIMGLTDMLFDPACSCGVGLLMWGIRNMERREGVGKIFSLLKSKGGRWRGRNLSQT